MNTTMRYSAAGMEAIRRGLKTLNQLSFELRVPVERLERAPKAEWHHNLDTGAKVWFYDPISVYRFVMKGRKIPWRSM